jgi:hypothetical protein
MIIMILFDCTECITSTVDVWGSLAYNTSDAVMDVCGFHHTISQGRRVDAFLYYTENFWALSGIRCVWCLPTSPHSITTQNNIVTSGYVQSPILQAVTLFQLYR